MIVAVPKETDPGERRVALVPETAGKLVKAGLDVRVEAGAGVQASFADAAYQSAGARVSAGTEAFWAEADVVLRTQKLGSHPQLGRHEAELVREGAAVVGLLYPFANRDTVGVLARRRVTSFSLDLLPRITRAQPMDALSAMSTVSGYKAVLLGAAASGR